jgi:hypothetical protein
MSRKNGDWGKLGKIAGSDRQDGTGNGEGTESLVWVRVIGVPGSGCQSG